MGWSCRKIGNEKLAENGCAGSGGELEARKTAIAMEIALKLASKEWEKNGKNDREKELETADRERINKKWDGKKNGIGIIAWSNFLEYQ